VSQDETVVILVFIEWLGLEGTSWITKFQPPSHRQGCQPLDQVLDQIAQGLIQPGLKHLHVRISPAVPKFLIRINDIVE